MTAVVASNFNNAFFFFFQAEDGIRDLTVTGVQTCALPIYERLDGDGDGQRLREHAALEEHEDATREPAEDAGDDEGQPLVRAHVDADGLRAPRVIARRAQREAEGCAADRGQDGEAGA